MSTSLMPPAGGDAALLALSAAKNTPASSARAGARASAQDFEAVFLNAMFSQMFTDIDGEGPFGGNQAAGIWRSFLTEEYSRSFAKAGGIGIAEDVYRSLLAVQEAR